MEEEFLSEILDTMSAKTLRSLIDKNMLVVQDRRVKQQMTVVLASHYRHPENLLLDLTEDELVVVAGLYDFEEKPSRLQNINTIMEFITSYGSDDEQEHGTKDETGLASPLSLSASVYSHEGNINNKGFSREAAKYLADTEEGRGFSESRANYSLAWNLFIAPGRIMTWVEYFFPAKGNVYASARRKDNKLVHILYASGFWLFVSVVILSAMSQAVNSPSKLSGSVQATPH